MSLCPRYVEVQDYEIDNQGFICWELFARLFLLEYTVAEDGSFSPPAPATKMHGHLLLRARAR